jgi:uncharacterized protein DUF3160
MRIVTAFFVLQIVIFILSQGAEIKAASDWEQDLSKAGFSAAEIKRLAKEKLLVSTQEIKQSFSAYLGHGPPNFVTSDAILNAYHVLFEETLRRQEELNAASLRRFCKEDWALLATIDRMYAGDTDAINAARQRVRFVLGVAVKLLSDDIQRAPEPLRKAIETEAALIEKAEGRHKPALLGRPEPDFIALDYTLFRPVGFYASSLRLQRYFRALRWLQLVPFRLERREEFLAFHMLEQSIGSPRVWKKDASGNSTRLEMIDKNLLPEGAGLESYLRLSQFPMDRDRFLSRLGLNLAHDEVGDVRVADQTGYPVKIDEVFFRKHAEALHERSSTEASVVVNDRIREASPTSISPEVRIVSAICLPEDAALAAVSRLKEVEPSTKRSPGLEFASWLGMPAAKLRLREQGYDTQIAALAKSPPERYPYAEEKDASKPWWSVLPENWGGSLIHYRAALGCLSETDPRAPAFMQGRIWEVKTLQTVTAAWAQERHAWSLQVMPEVHFLKSPSMPQGFIEPAPAFFMRMSHLAGHLGVLAAETESMLDPAEPFIEEAADHVRWLREAAGSKASKQDLFGEVWDATRFLGDFEESFDSIDAEKATAADAMGLIEKMNSCAARLRAEARPGTVLWGKVQSKRLWTDRLWHQLEILCMRLSLLADKQLNHLPFSENEARFIEYIGMELSEIMLYRGQAWTYPNDDAPRIARLFSDLRSGAVVMHVGIGRPRLMYVLYPWQGREVLCRGVVMPYHETEAAKSLTDAEWHQQFEGGTRPPVPAWLKDLVPTQQVSLQAP